MKTRLALALGLLLSLTAGPLLASLRATPEAFVADSTSLVSNDLSSPWVVKRPTKAGGWWVVAEVSDDEAMASHWATMYAFWGLLVAATAVLGLGLYWLVRRNVSRPLGSLTVAVTAVANGDPAVIAEVAQALQALTPSPA